MGNNGAPPRNYRRTERCATGAERREPPSASGAGLGVPLKCFSDLLVSFRKVSSGPAAWRLMVELGLMCFEAASRAALEEGPSIGLKPPISKRRSGLRIWQFVINVLNGPSQSKLYNRHA
ncbi:hypothetical protein GN956_G838 [Arapaima gigas]